MKQLDHSPAAICRAFDWVSVYTWVFDPKEFGSQLSISWLPTEKFYTPDPINFFYPLILDFFRSIT